jgi:D-arabinose 1-dehydrogenase-like Zn-dependent alcohol dehydrogenase
MHYPVRPGHEVAGKLVEVSTPGERSVGEWVVLYPLLACGTCAACQRGHENLCRVAGVLGIDHAGGMATMVDWPLTHLVPIGSVDAVAAAILPDAVASAYHALRLARVPAGGSLTVIGAGGVGANVLQLARALDPEVRLTAIVRSAASAARIERLALDVAVRQGLTGAGRAILKERGPQDAVIEFGAGAAAGPEALPMLVRGGRLVFGSVEDAPLNLGTRVIDLVTREIVVMGSYASTRHDLQTVTELARAGRIDIGASVSHRLPLRAAGEAIRLLEQRPPGLARVVLEVGG